VTKRKLLQDISNDISVAESTGQVLSQLAARVAAGNFVVLHYELSNVYLAISHITKYIVYHH